jgi:hypothetical protein
VTATSRERLSSGLTAIQAVILVLAVPTLICLAIVLLAVLIEWFSVCLSGQIFAFCMKSWTFPFSSQTLQSLQNDFKTILILFAITATVAIVQCCLIAVPLSYYLSQGVAKDAQRGWRFYATIGGLVAALPWATLLLVNHNGFGAITTSFLLFVIGAVVGLCMKWLLLRKATRESQKNLQS